MYYLLGFISISCFLTLIGRIDLLRIPKYDTARANAMTRQAQLVAGMVFLFVGILFSLTTYSIVIKDNPFWFIDHVYAIFT